MSTTTDEKVQTERKTADTNEDSFLASIHDLERRYHEMRAVWDDEVQDVRDELDLLRQANQKLKDDLQHTRGQLEHQTGRAERHKHRARHLAEGLKSIHRALFSGNVFDLILKCCLTITGGTRGLYLTLEQGKLRVRAAIDVDGYPKAPPSAYFQALCQKVLDDEKTLVCRKGDAPAGLPRPADPAEEFHNFIAAPVALLKHFSGVVVVADKLHGEFDDEDVDTVLAVGDQACVAVENQRLHRDLQAVYLAVVGILADAVEAKDAYTHGHCEMVARYARLTAEQLLVNDATRSIVCYGGLLHDIGKIGISDGILNKPGKLAPEEWDLMRSHVRVGRDLLAHVRALDPVADVVLHHHEAYDGKGYPDGLKGEEITLASRIVCVADAYCAMISKRSYKESFTDEQARAELLRCRGTQFDPAVVDAFLVVMETLPHLDDCDNGSGCGLPPWLDEQNFHLALDRKAGDTR